MEDGITGVSGEEDSTSSALPPITVPWEYLKTTRHAFEYHGFHEGSRNGWIIGEMAACHSNLVSTNVAWLRDAIAYQENGIGINPMTPQIETFSDFLDMLGAGGWQLSVDAGIVTGTNFHDLPEWVGERYPDIFVQTASGERVPLQFERQMDLTSYQSWHGFEEPHLNQAKCDLVRVVLERYGNDPRIIAWSMDGESLYPPNVRSSNVGDYSPLALAHFRAWIQRKYGNLNALNSQWGTQYKSWGDVEPPRRLELSAAALDWHQFRIEAQGEYLQSLQTVYCHYAAEKLKFAWLHDVGLRGSELIRTGVDPSIYGLVADGLNADPIVRPPDYLYNVRYFDVMNSFDKPVISREYSYFPRPIPPDEVRFLLYELLGMGLWSVGIVHYSPTSGGDIDWGVQGTPAEPVVAQIYAEAERLKPYLSGMFALRPEVRIFVSRPTWIFGGWKEEYNDVHTELVLRNIPRLFLFDNQLGRERFWPQWLISAGNDLVTTETLKHLEEFLRSGRELILVGNLEGSRVLPLFQGVVRLRPEAFSEIIGSEYEEGVLGSASFRIYRYTVDGKPRKLLWLEHYASRESVGDIISKFLLNEGYQRPANLISGSVRSYLLTDQLNFIQVLVNPNAKEETVRVCRPLLLDPAYKYDVIDLQHQIELGPAEGEKTVVIAPKSAAILLYKVRLEATVVDSAKPWLAAIAGELARAEKEGFDTSLGRFFVSMATSAIDAGFPWKAMAWIKRLNSLLLVALDGGDNRSISGKVRAVNGDSQVASIEARVVPLFDAPQSIEINGDCFQISLARLPTVYDYDASTYRDFTGPIEVRVSVWGKNGAYGFGSLYLDL